MIPWGICFSGIRDFTDTRLELGGHKDHVLIGGPNGSGKSTVTFCLGAVLASPKVDLEGLRSRNLPADRVWRATIELVFDNSGDYPVDAAACIGFRLNLEQKPGDPLRKEYWIYEGEEPWQWQKETRYTPGDGTNHLHEYRHQLQHKFKVDPDAFYLIWYQQDVNQFAVMRPEERFRIFSEMTGIERMQHNWEMVKEERKDAFLALQTAENNQHQHKLNLGNWQQERDRLLSRNERRKMGLQHALIASAVLCEKQHQEIRVLQERMEALDELQGEEIDKWMRLEDEYKHYQEEMNRKTMQKEESDRLLQDLEGQMAELQEQHSSMTQEHRQLADLLQELAEKIKAVPYSEAEVRERLAVSQEQLAEMQQKLEETQEAYRQAQEQLDRLAQDAARFKYEMGEDQRKLDEAEAMVGKYGGSAGLEKEAEQLENRRIVLQDHDRKLDETLHSLHEELRALTHNEIRSLRQDTSIRYLERKGLTVYTMRDLLEMDDNSPLEQEKKLEPVKYTLFVDGKGFSAPTDLYHVELPLIIPERTLDELSELGLRVKKELNDKSYAAAQKALWWIHKLVAEAGDRKIALRNGLLLDSWGRRGAQENLQWLLNPKGIALRIKQIHEEISKLEQQQQASRTECTDCETRLRLIRSILHQIRTAEGVVQDIARRDWTKKEWERTLAEQAGWMQKRDRLYYESQNLNEPLVERKVSIQAMANYMCIYDEARGQSSELERLRQLGEELEIQKGLLKQLERDLEDKLAASDQLERSIDSTGRRLREKAQFIADVKRALDDFKRDKKEASERYGVVEQSYAAEQQFYQEWTERLPAVLAAIVDEYPDFPPAINWNESEAGHEKERSLVQLQHACGETVDENALENYEKVKQEYERGAQEVQEARSLLQQLEDSLKELEEKLVNTIHYEVKRVNQMFVHYMDLFSFDGEVSWDMQELKQGNIKYFLNIKARKQGHRGALEEISMKGRGGRVGKGVSGGEESLGSLLFALALLKTIQANPGYIVLDEFDSALDEGRKSKVFLLYQKELARKMIILSPKSHESDYVQHFNEAFVVYHDARIPQSAVIRIKKREKISI
ncbi:chromosome segregation protein SMC [Paenibacillus mesotrionivorans]|uniref:Chromosome segregation protein SMC n=1 Tax=Paenibacillus mesotrionivorans TaxID=3160968 RepID=A0ACC7P3E9_9BACL